MAPALLSGEPDTQADENAPGERVQRAPDPRADGAMLVIGWISEDFDGTAAGWCFRHRPRDPGEPGAWLAVLNAECRIPSAVGSLPAEVA